MSSKEIIIAIQELSAKIDRLSERINVIEDATVNNSRIDDILHRMNEIKEIVDGTEGKVYDLWEKKDDTNA